MNEKSRLDKYIFKFTNNKYMAPILFGAIGLTSILTFGKTVTESFFKNEDLKAEVLALKNRIDTISQSLKKFDFELVNYKAVPTEKNIYYAKNATGINYGQVGDVYNESKTYNQSNAEKSSSTSAMTPVAEMENIHDVEIESPNAPNIGLRLGENIITYKLKTKNKEEANDVTDAFSFVYKTKGILEVGDRYQDQNSTVITNYPTDFIYSFSTPQPNIDTSYFFLKITFTNSVGKRQIPFKVLYRKSNNTGQKLVQLFTGTKEYKEVIEIISVRNGI